MTAFNPTCVDSRDESRGAFNDVTAWRKEGASVRAPCV